MILYTMMPAELIYPPDETQFSNQLFVEVCGVSMLVERNEDQGYRIVRLLSSDPQHFLNDEYLPGSTISIQ
ncbi:YlzJ-like family protein [Bacillus sp. DJP31]|uniref:YlzJ-like family protein n=1 Tax=Bacillus sp. DJP31 TaxID=3409789 RepID=UPI003BB4CF5A